MSWDIAIARFEPCPSDMEELAEAKEVPLGSEAVVKAALASLFPGIIWQGGSGTYSEGEDKHGISAEIHPSGKQRSVIDSLMFMAHFGSANEADCEAFIDRIKSLNQQQGWTAVDCGSGELIV